MSLYRYRAVPIQECGEPLVDLDGTGLIVAPAYYEGGLATCPTLYLRHGVVDRLVAVKKVLQPLSIEVWDGWRSRDVQRAIYDDYWSQLAAANPQWSDDELATAVAVFVTDGSDSDHVPPHATGGAVDMTLVDGTGRELDMGTSFDHFGPESAALYYEEQAINTTVRDNRRLLRHAMEGAGFWPDPDEWWHFDLGDQVWAYATGAPVAYYGEALLPS